MGLAERGWAQGSCVAGGRLVCLGRGAEILYSLAVAHARRAGLASQFPLSNFALLTDARRTLGLFQHHDAITGTAKEAVVVDYGVRWESPPLPHPLYAAAHHPQYENAPGGRWAGLLGARPASRWTVSQWSPLPWSLSCPPSQASALPCQPETGHHERSSLPGAGGQEGLPL